MPATSHFLHLSVSGGLNHRLVTAMTAVTAAWKGYRVHDMTRYVAAPFQPDVVASMADKAVRGAHRDDITVTYFLEVIDTHDPEPDWKKPSGGRYGMTPSFDDIIKIRIGEWDERKFKECVEELLRVIP